MKTIRQVAVLLALAAAAPACRAAEPVPASYFGMTLNAPLTTPWPQIGFASLRTWDMNISWSDIETARGRYDWRKFDAILDLARARHVDLVYTFGRTPRWASLRPDAPGAYGPGQCSPPADLSDWDDFVRAVVARAAGGIRYWEVWNEPQDENFYCGDIGTMVAMQQRAFRIVKAADPSLKVLTPSPTGGLGPAWLAKFLLAGGSGYADIVGFHGYWSARARALPAVISRFRTAARLGGVGDMPMWDTEAGWGRDPPGMDDDRKAAFVAKYYLLHWSLGVRRLYWYSYDNELGWGTLWNRKEGLLLPGIAYEVVRSWMLGASMDRPCAPDGASDPVWTCGFERAGGYRAIALWAEGEPRTYRLPPGFGRVRDLTGGIRSLETRDIQVGSSPVLVESGRGDEH